MMRTADVVIIGGGVIGASVAYHLAARGRQRIVVLDRSREPGAGSTGKATGGFRAQFSTRVNVQLSLLAREKLLRFPGEIGVDPGYSPCGYLFLASEADQLALLRTAIAVQHEAGLRETKEIAPEEAARLNPAVPREAVVGGAFCSIDGFIRPLEILRGYLDASRRRGVTVEFGAGPARCVVERGRVTAVRTDTARIATPCVVNAAGAWAGVVGADAGVDLPVRPLRRQVAVMRPSPFPDEMPMTVFVEDGFHFRVRDGDVLLLWPADLSADDPFDTTFETRWLDGLLERARAHVPQLRNGRVDRTACWAGLYEMSPDRHAIFGRAPEVEGFYLVTGSSGHGVMHAPALGQLAAELILDGAARTVDVRALHPARFAQGKLNPESSLL